MIDCGLMNYAYNLNYVMYLFYVGLHIYFMFIYV